MSINFQEPTMVMQQPETKKGFVTLILVLVLGVLGASAAVILLTTSTTASKTIQTFQSSFVSKALADACAEEALEQIRRSTSFSGSGNLSLGGNSCSYNVTTGSGENRTISGSATYNQNTRKFQISITQISPTILVSSWQEVQ